MVGNNTFGDLSPKSVGSVGSNRSVGNSGRIRQRPDQAARMRTFVSFDKSIPTKRRGHSNNSLGNASFSSFNGSHQNSKFNLSNASGFGSAASFGSNGRLGSTGSFSRLQSVSGMRRTTSQTSSSGGLSTCSGSSSQRRWKGNGVMQMVQRSNAGSVKTVISEIQRRCDEATATKLNDGDSSMSSIDDSAMNMMQTSSQPDVSSGPPLQEFAMLSHWAVDAYYKVVISKYQGISAIVRAMNTFPDNADLQAYGCSALKKLSNKLSIQEAGGTAAVISAMKNHSQSIHVQSEACEALTAQAPLFHKEPPATLSGLIHELMGLLANAKNMYLTESGAESVKFLVEFLPTLVPEVYMPNLDNQRMKIDAMEV